MTSSNQRSRAIETGASAGTLVRLLLFASRADLSVDEAAAALDACMHRRDTLGLGGVYAISAAHVVQLIEGPHATVHAFLAETRTDLQWSTLEVLAETVLPMRWFAAGHTSLRFLSGELAAPYSAALVAWAGGDRHRAAVVLGEALIING